MKKQVLVIGIGNEFRSDDNAGLYSADLILDAICETPLKDIIEVMKLSGEGAELIDKWQDFNNVYIIDASRKLKSPGKITRIDTSRDALEKDYFHYSSHNFSLAEAEGLARQMNMLPGNMIIYAIEGYNFNTGKEMTEEVEISCLKTSRMILEEISLLIV